MKNQTGFLEKLWRLSAKLWNHSPKYDEDGVLAVVLR